MRPETEEDTAVLSSTTSRNLVSAELGGLEAVVPPEVNHEEEKLEAKTPRENSLQETLGQRQQSIDEEAKLTGEHSEHRLDKEQSEPGLQVDKDVDPGVRGEDQGPGEDPAAEAGTTRSALRTLSANPPPLQHSGIQSIGYNHGVFCFSFLILISSRVRCTYKYIVYIFC